MIARIRTPAGLFWFISCPVHSWDVSMPWAQKAGACSRSAERGLIAICDRIWSCTASSYLPGGRSFRSNWVSQLGSVRRPDDEPLYEVIACTLEGQAVTSDAGFTIAVKRDADALATAQTLIIPPTNVRTSPTSREAHHHRHQRAAPRYLPRRARQSLRAPRSQTLTLPSLADAACRASAALSNRVPPPGARCHAIVGASCVSATTPNRNILVINLTPTVLGCR